MPIIPLDDDIWVDDHEGIKNGFFENYTGDLSGNKIPKGWTKETRAGASTLYQMDDGSATVKNNSGSDVTISPSLGNSWTKLTVATGGAGEQEHLVYQEFHLTEQEIGKPIPYYVFLLHNAYNISTVNRSVNWRIGYSKDSGELVTNSIPNTTTLVTSIHAGTFVSEQKTVYFNIGFNCLNAGAVGDYLFIDGFGPSRALMVDSEIRLQRNSPNTTWS